ncbi:hypothetical protein H2202_008941 [Exophiala xenobiotica]|nr:hypothetical protein H2202_008941 [Exophiala xenobiotica]
MSFIRKIVHNDAVKLDPPEVYNWRVFALAAAACFGGTLFGMDIGIIGGVLTLPDFKKEYGLGKNSANLSANLVSVMQAGAILGSLVANPLSDWIGRKKSILVISVFAFIGGLLQAFAYGSFACFYIGRFVEGLGLGGATMLAPTYVAENAPRGIRGLLVGFYQLFETMGAMVAFFINYGSLLHLKGHSTWIVPLSMQSLPPLLLFCSIFFCPESPRWLASRDNWDKASSILSTVRQLPATHPYVQAELLEMKTQLDAERGRAGGNSYWALTKEAWTIPGNRKRCIMVIVLMIAQQMTGTNAINYYAPTIFTDLGVTGNSNSLFATGVYGIVKMCSCAIFITFLADTLGRRWSFVWTGFFMWFCMFYLGFYVRFDAPAKGAPISGAGYAALVSEISTQRLRGLTVSYAACTQWIFNLVVARSTPVMLTTVGSHGYGTYFIYGSFCFTIAVGAYFLVPETKGVSLERMDELFGTTDFSGIEDVGMAAQHAKGDIEAVHLEGQRT